jgi:hypothetical protein
LIFGHPLPGITVAADIARVVIADAARLLGRHGFSLLLLKKATLLGGLDLVYDRKNYLRSIILTEILTHIAQILSVLRSLPFWVLAGLTSAGWAILFTSTRTEALLFRQEWGTYIWAGTIVFSFLTLMYAVQGIVLAYLAYKKEQEQKKALRFVPLLQKSWWHLAKQQDGSFCSQISLDVQASNSTTAPVNLVMVDLDRPKNSVLQAFVLLPADGSPYHSHQHPVPAQATITASVHIMVRGALSRQGKPIHINLSIVDQHGTAYKLRKLHIKTHDIALRRRGIFQWIKDCRIKRQLPPVMPWNFSQAEYLQLCDAVLQEEKRSYAANGRLRGGLGSLNVTLQSEPNFGWTTVGQIPQLLWPQGQGVTITSTNMTRLMNIHSGLDAQGKDNLERYLLAHLIKDSDFSDIGYFIFLALHRMERTVDALKTARTFLKGDRVHGYSNLLGTLSAVVSHEHVHFDHHLYQPLLDALSNDDEYDFRLRHKINLARLEHLDRTDTPTENITH